MTGIARKNEVDTVDTVHGATGGNNCNASKTNTATNEGSSDVFVNGTGVVRKGDKVKAHNNGVSCATHETPLSTYSPNVFANNKEIGRKNDTYSCGAKITSASTNVFANGS